MAHLLHAALFLSVLAPPAAADALRLMMIEQPGCHYCARWDAEIAPQYPLTDEGRTAPLVRTDLRAALPDGVTLDRPAAFTPTFVLLRDGHEAGRLEGYPGTDFFWPLLQDMITVASAAPVDE